MRFGAIVTAGALPLALTACGQGETTSTQSKEIAANEAAPVTALSAQSFVNKMAASDRFELETSKLAPGSAASSGVMAFARQMVVAHSASTTKLKGAVAKTGGIVINDELSPSQKAALQDLKMKKGYIFDAAYIAAQVYGHDQTLSELKAYADAGDNAALKGYAGEMIPLVSEHLHKAQTLK